LDGTGKEDDLDFLSSLGQVFIDDILPYFRQAPLKIENFHPLVNLLTMDFMMGIGII